MRYQTPSRSSKTIAIRTTTVSCSVCHLNGDNPPPGLVRFELCVPENVTLMAAIHLWDSWVLQCVLWWVRPEGAVGYFSNERGFSVESSYKSFHQIFDFIVAETKQFVGSNVNVILTRQTCGQCLSMSAGSKRRALRNYFAIRICCMSLISKCRGAWDLGLCTFWVLS